MKRYVLSPIVGDGSYENPYRSKVTDYGVNHVVVIPNKADGAPKFNWCLCLVSAADLSTLLADSQINGFPDITLDTTLSVLTAQQKQTALNFLTNKGIDVTGLTNQSTFRDVLSRCGKFLDAIFDTNKFDVAD